MIFQHPGPWQYFVKRKDNINLNVLEQKQKYILEESQYYSQLNIINQNNWNNALGGGPTRTTEQPILYEPFGLNGLNGLGFPYYNTPSGWTNDSEVVFYGDSDVIPFCDIVDSSGTIYCAFSNGSATQQYLITKAISTTGKTNIKLNFNEYRGLTTIPPSLTLDYSPDNGSTWLSIVWTETSTILNWVNSGDINLPSNAENKSQLKIRIGMLGDGSGEITAIDDFKIKATF